MNENNPLMPWNVQKRIKMLGSRSREERVEACRGLAKAAANEKTREATISALIDVLEGGDREAKKGAAEALRHVARRADIGRALPALMRIFGNSDLAGKKLCLQVFKEAAEHEADLRPVIMGLMRARVSPGESSVRDEIDLAMLGALQNEKSRGETISLLLNAIEDMGAGLRKGALALIRTAAWKGLDISWAFPALVETLRCHDADARVNAAGALENASAKGADISKAIPGLMAALGNNKATRKEMLNALREAGKNPKSRNAGIPEFIRILEDPDVWRRGAAHLLLKECGPRDYGDLKEIALIARKLSAEKKDIRSITALYSIWSKELGKRAGELWEKKDFPPPRIRESEGFERVHRVRRLMHPGRA